MGFRYKRFDYYAGVAPWTGQSFSNSPSDSMARSQAVCKDFADFIISCGKGWSLDIGKNATTNDFVSVPIWNSSKTIQSYTAPGLFFVNSNGCKLFLSIIGTASSYGLALEKDNFALDTVSSGVQHVSGVVMSMIPSGSTSNFGATFDSSFLPSDATLIRGTVELGSDAASSVYGVAENRSGYIYSYGLFVDAYCVGISGVNTSSSSPVTLYPGYWCGRILGSLANNETRPDARYGTLSFSFANVWQSVNYEFAYKTLIDESGTRFDRWGWAFTNAINTYVANNFLSIVSKEGLRLNASAGNIRFYSEVLNVMDTKVLSTSFSDVMWVPYMVAVCSNNLNTYGIVPGNGFKGLLDTDLFRCGICTLNQSYSNGRFRGWTYMLIVGWDPLNTDSL